MWHTSEGDRTLHGAEATLVKAAITRMAEICTEERDFSKIFEYQVPIYDELEHDDRLRLLEIVATHLLMPTPAPLKLSAVIESIVGAIYAQMRIEVEIEIGSVQGPFAESEDEWSFYYRTLILNAFHERRRESIDIDDTIPVDTRWYPEAARWAQMEQWNNVIEFLADQILWDRDYELASLLVDQSPEVASKMKSLLGIDDEYFIDTGLNDIATLDDRSVLLRIHSIGPQT